MLQIKQIFLSIPQTKLQIIDIANIETLQNFKDIIYEKFQITGFNLYCENKILNNIKNVKDLQTIYLNFQLLGGKGGFGSLLKAQACNIKALNTDASRDLEGRRMRNVTNLQTLKDFLQNKKKQEDDLKDQQEQAKVHFKKQKDDQNYQKIQKDYIQKQDKWHLCLKQSIRKGLKIAKVPEFHVDNQIQNNQDYEQISKKVKIEINEENNYNNQDKIQKQNNLLKQNNDLFQQVYQQFSHNNQVQINQQNENDQICKLDDQLIDLNEISSLDDILKLGGDKIKFQLQKLGLKIGGSLQEKAQRLYDIKLDPSCLFNSKYLAKFK